jgi:hypothetical protein
MTKGWTSAEPDLFEEPAPAAPLAAAERAKAMQQLQALLIEALATSGIQRQAGDDQDYA